LAARARRVDADVKRLREYARRVSGADKSPAEGAWGQVLELVGGEDVEALSKLAVLYRERKPLAEICVLARLAAAPDVDAAQRREVERRIAELRRMGLAPADGRPVAETADDCLRREKWSDAIEHYQVALNVAPYLASARANLVRAYLARRLETRSAADGRGALDAANVLVRLLPDDAAAWTLRSAALLATGDAVAAEVDAIKATKLDDRHVPALLAAGRAQLELPDKVGSAMANFSAAMKREASPEAMLGLALAHEKRGDAAEARSVIDALRARFDVPRGLEPELRALMERISGGR
jgi:tetratricopeptide (TPR) repeat protein